MSDTTLTALTARLAQLSRELDAAQAELARAQEVAVRNRHAANVAEAKAFLVAEGSVDARRKIALVETADLLLTAELAEAKVRSQQQNFQKLRSQAEIGRTLIASSRAEMQLAGVAS